MRVVAGAHYICPTASLLEGYNSVSTPFAGMTRIRFCG
jgi:hypothetical protein